MVNHFSTALIEYYRRSGNKVVFKNGMSLNALAWEMWEKLGFREIDPSVISRVLKGDRLFTPRQFTTFAQIMKLPPKREKQLRLLLLNDYLRRFGFDVTKL